MALPLSLPARQEGNFFIQAARCKPVRTFLQFAEEEVVLPETGPKGGELFDADFMPFTRLVLQEFENPAYRRFFAAGPTQSGKTLLFFNIPLLYHLCELQEDVIIGVPSIDMAQDIYEDRILPILLNSGYAWILPTSGIGSKGGRFTKIRMKNGATLRFMGTSKDAQVSSHTARVVIMTEIDKMAASKQKKEETDPVGQLEARTHSFGDDFRIYGECTMSNEGGRIFNETTIFGTNTRVFFKCSYCGEYIEPKREDFIGWQDQPDELAAGEEAGLACSECGSIWNEEDRLESLNNPMLVSEGQTVKDGNLTGKRKNTITFGMKWNAVASRMVPFKMLARDEWLAAKDEDNEDRQKLVVQFRWAMPYKSKKTSLIGVSEQVVMNKTNNWMKGIVPDHALKLTCFVDVGAYICWYGLVAWAEKAIGHLITYGSLHVDQGKEIDEMRVKQTLRAFRDDYLAPGFKFKDGIKQIDACGVDAGYLTDTIYDFCKESGARYMATMGFGSGVSHGKRQGQWQKKVDKEGQKIGNNWHIVKQPNGQWLLEMHADHWKRKVHAGFNAEPGTPGSISLFKADPRVHRNFAQQICAEQEQEEFKESIGVVKKFVVLGKQNHFLDVTYGNRCLADVLGIKIDETPIRKLPPAPKKTRSVQMNRRRIRSRY